VLLSVDKTFWAHHPTELHWLLSIAGSVIKQYGSIVERCENFLSPAQHAAGASPQ
jgi:hypothetical protein